jgi:hypothetical protein
MPQPRRWGFTFGIARTRFRILILYVSNLLIHALYIRIRREHLYNH